MINNRPLSNIYNPVISNMFSYLREYHSHTPFAPVHVSSDHSVSQSVARHWLSIGLVTGEQGGIDGLHTAGASQTPHQPIIDAAHVISVHARKVSQGIPDEELHHADNTLSRFLTPVIQASWQVLDQADTFRNLHLLLFSQLRHRPGHTRRRMVHRRGCLNGQRFLQERPNQFSNTIL